MDEIVTLASCALPFAWHVPPVQWSQHDPSSLTFKAGAVTDLFINPQGAPPMLNAPRLLTAVAGDFQFSARVTVEFAATFDAGVLLLWGDATHWAKLCFEYSPRRQPMVVSVVTRATSDDANGFVADANHIRLRVARLGSAFAFHASTDGRTLDLVRHFALDLGETVNIGFLAQYPTGAGCTASFDDVHFVPERLGDLRGGE